MKDLIWKRTFFHKLISTFRFNHILSLLRDQRLFNFFLFLEILPIFIILDEIIFIRSTNHVISLFYFFSSNVWERLIENRLAFKLNFPDEFLIKQNKELNLILNNSYNFTDLVNAEKYSNFINEKKKQIFCTCMNFYLEKNNSVSDKNIFHQYNIFSTNYNIYYDKNFSISLIILITILITLLMMIILFLEKNLKLIFFFASNLINIITRVISFYFILLIVNRLFENIFLSEYANIDISFTNNYLGTIASSLIYVFLLIILLGFFLFYYYYVDFTCCFDDDYPYDFRSIPYDIFLALLKFIGASLYNFQKTSCVLNLFNNFFRIICFLFILIIIIMGIYFFFILDRFIKFSNSNKVRCNLVFYLNVFLFFKILEYYFDLYEMSINYVLLFVYFITCIVIYFIIKNYGKSKKFIKEQISNFENNEISDGFFKTVFKNIFGLNKNKEDKYVINETSNNYSTKKKKLKNIIIEILDLTNKYLDLLKLKDTLREENFISFFTEFLSLNSHHKFFCRNNFNKILHKNSKGEENTILFKSPLFENKKFKKKKIKQNSTSKKINVIELQREREIKHDFLYVRFVKTKIEDEQIENRKSFSIKCCDFCQEDLFNKYHVENLHNLNLTEINFIIQSFFNSIAKKLFPTLKGNFYYEIFRINLFWINTYNNKIDQKNINIKVLYDLKRNFNLHQSEKFSKEFLNFDYFL